MRLIKVYYEALEMVETVKGFELLYDLVRSDDRITDSEFRKWCAAYNDRVDDLFGKLID